MKNIKRALKSIALSSIISALLVAPTFAAPKDLPRVTIDPVFTDSDGPWFPGKSQLSTIKITNNGSRTIALDKIYFNLTSSKYINNKDNSTLDKGIEEMLSNSEVKITYEEKTIFNGSFENLLNKDGFLIKDKNIRIGSKGSKTLDIEINMNGADYISNDAQSIQSVYSIKLDYRVDDSSGGGGNSGGGGGSTTPTPDPDPDNPGGSEDGDNSNPDNPGGSEDGDNSNPDNPGGSEDGDNPNPDNPGGSEDGDNLNPDNPGGSENGGNSNKPGTGGSDNNIGNSTDKLPQTGGILNSTTLTILGLSVAGIGVVMDKKSSSKKGGKKDE